MKRLFQIVLVFLFLVGCSANKEPFIQTEISATQLQEKLDTHEDFVLMVERDNCAYCKAMNNYIEKTKGEHGGIEVFVLNTTDFGFSRKSEDSNVLISNTDDGQILLQMAPYFSYTPAIYVIQDGKVVDSGIGFNQADATVTVWDNMDQVVNFDTAQTEDLWDFIETYA